MTTFFNDPHHDSTTTSEGGQFELPVDPRPWPALSPASFYGLKAKRDQLVKEARRPKSAAARRRQAMDRRAALIDMVESADPDEFMWDVLLNLADSITRDPEFPIPGDWFFGFDWFRSGVLQIVGDQPHPDDTIVFRSGASSVRMGAFRWSSSECYAWIWPKAFDA